MKHAALLLSFLVGLCFSGCGVLKAPDLEIKKRSVSSGDALGLIPMCDADVSAGDCGIVKVNESREATTDGWIYWKAGASELLYHVTPEQLGSASWDMRITSDFPLVGTNGGATAADEAYPYGKAAFAVVPDSMGRFIPKTKAQIADYVFTSDVHDRLEYKGAKTELLYHNPVVNTIGPGMLKDYIYRTHDFSLSYRVFILRAVDGNGYYALRFISYSNADKATVFEWRKLQ